MAGPDTSLLDEAEAALRRQTGASLYGAVQQNPDEAAKAQRYAAALGLPVETVTRNMPEASRRVQLQNSVATVQAAPTLQSWATDPNNAAVAHDQFEPLAAIEHGWADLMAGKYRPMNPKEVTDSYVHLTQSLWASAAGGLGSTVRGVGEGIDAADRTGASGGRSGIPLVDDYLANMNLTALSQRFTGKSPTAIGTTASRPLTDIADRDRARQPGMVHDVVRFGGGLVPLVAQGFVAPQTLPLTFGAQGVDQVHQDALAMGVAGTPGADKAELASGGIQAALATVPFAKYAEGILPEIANPFLRATAHVGVGTAAQAGVGAAMQTGTNVAEKATFDPNKDLGAGVAESALTMGLLHFIPAVPGAAHEIATTRAEAARTTAEVQAFDGLAKAAGASPVAERAPERFQALMRAITEGEDIYVPADAVREYMQKLQPAEQARFAEATGNPDQLGANLQSGADVPIPADRYLTYIAQEKAFPGAHEAFKDELRVGPEGMSAKDAAGFEQAYQDFIEHRGQELLEQARREAESAAPAQRVYGAAFSKFREAGYSIDAAQKYAALLSAHNEAFGKLTGRDAWEEFSAFPLDIRRVMPDDLRRQIGRADLVIDALRQSKKAPGQPPSLLDFLSKEGLDDTGGELAAMDAGRWHRGKPFRRQLIRQGGRTMGDAAVNAWEAGYFPDFTDEPPTGAHLQEAVRQELAGKPRIATPLDQRKSDFKAAVSQLDELLGRIGLDAQKASNTEIKAALDRWTADDEAKGATFEQGRKGSDRRGSIEFPEDGSAIIRLFQAADPSTPIHELGHFFLERLKRSAEAEAAPEPVKDLWTTAQKWLGHEGGDLTVDQHEQFARGFEAYAMEGKAPSEGLRGVFRRFGQWLTRIYRSVASLDVKMTPQIRDVFDRLLASEDEIKAAKAKQAMNPVFASPEDAGMTQAEFSAYAKAIDRADASAEDTLLERLTRNIRAAKTKEWREERAKVREEASAEVDAQPDVKAYWLLSKGELLGADKADQPSRVQLDRDALVEMYGTDAVLGRMPPNSVTREGGVHPDQAAEWLDMRSGEHLAERLMSLEDTRRALPEGKRDLRKFLTDQATDARMAERHGDPLHDGSIEDEAQDALHDEQRAKALAIETRALEKITGQEGRWTTALLKRYAEETVAQLKTDELRPDVYLRAERKAANEAQRELVKAKPDHAAALEAKQRQVLNFHLYRAARDASAEVAKGSRRLNRYASRKTYASMAQPYLEQIHGLLERFGWKVPDMGEPRLPFSQWLGERLAKGETVVAPDWITDGVSKPTLTVQEFRELHDLAENVAHLGREAKKVLASGRRAELDALVTEARAKAAGLKTMRQPQTFDYEGRKRFLRGADAALLKIETMADWLDDGDPNGVFNRVLIHGASDAHATENELFSNVGDKLREGWEAVPKEVRRSWRNKVEAPELKDPRTGEGSTLNKGQVLGIALNTGNASNIEKMLTGYGWGAEDVQAVLHRTMTKADWDYVQSVWNTLESLWPRIAETEKRLTGLVPEKVEHTPVQTPFGQYAGGYYPVVYDHELAATGKAKTLDDLFNQFMVGVATPKGHTISRTRFKAPVLLSPEAVVFDHVNKVIKRVAYGEYAASAKRFIEDPRIRDLWSEKVGPEYYKEAMPWLQRQVGYRMVDPRAIQGVERFLRAARINFTTASSAIRATVLAEHAAAFPQSAAVIGEKWLAHGMAEYAATLGSAEKFIYDRSAEMRFRQGEVTRDIRDALADLSGKTDAVSKARELAHLPVSWVNQHVVAFPTWLGGYRRGLSEGMSEEQAIRYADKAVRVSHSSGAAKDLARAQDPQGEAYKLFTMFYGYHNAQYQLQRRVVWGAGHAKTAGDVGEVFRQGALTMILAPIIGAFVTGKLDLSDPKAAAEEAFVETIRALWQGLPYARDVLNAEANKVTGRPGDYEVSPIARGVTNVLQAVEDVRRAGFHAVGADAPDPSPQWLKHLIDGAGFATGLPLGQVATSAQYGKEVAEGEERPETPLDFLSGLAFGAPHKHAHH